MPFAGNEAPFFTGVTMSERQKGETDLQKGLTAVEKGVTDPKKAVTEAPTGPPKPEMAETAPQTAFAGLKIASSPLSAGILALILGDLRAFHAPSAAETSREKQEMTHAPMPTGKALRWPGQTRTTHELTAGEKEESSPG